MCFQFFPQEDIFGLTFVTNKLKALNNYIAVIFMDSAAIMQQLKQQFSFAQ